jgi:uncharacterized protein YbjT (DUF2867 family)
VPPRTRREPRTKVAVFGATGFVGRRLIPQLEEAGHDVVALTRRPGHYEGAGTPRYADLDDPASVATALADVRVAYHLVHALGTAGFDAREQRHAATLAAAAEANGLHQILFLSGLGRDDDRLSKHLRSRHAVERTLQGGATPVTVLRAGILIGAGSAGWEILRQTTELLPLVVTDPRARTKHQPIAADDAIGYLIDALDHPGCRDEVFDIGGADVLRYRDMVTRLARLTRRFRPRVEVLWLPRVLTGTAVGLLTDVNGRTARDLLGSIGNETVMTNQRISEVLPRTVLGFDDAARLALAETIGSNSPTAWAQAGIGRVLRPLLGAAEDRT